MVIFDFNFARVEQIPGVRAAGLISLLPLQNSGWSGFFTIPGRSGLLKSELRYVTPGYFRAMGIPLRAGREFSPRDGPGAHRVILVNEALVRQFFNVDSTRGRYLSPPHRRLMAPVDLKPFSFPHKSPTRQKARLSSNDTLCP